MNWKNSAPGKASNNAKAQSAAASPKRRAAAR
jgi:hypothetical protein